MAGTEGTLTVEDGTDEVDEVASAVLLVPAAKLPVVSSDPAPLAVGNAQWTLGYCALGVTFVFVSPDAAVSGVLKVFGTNGLGDGEPETPAPLGLRPLFTPVKDPRGRPRAGDGRYCGSKLLLERTEVKWVGVWVGFGVV